MWYVSSRPSLGVIIHLRSYEMITCNIIILCAAAARFDWDSSTHQTLNASDNLICASDSRGDETHWMLEILLPQRSALEILIQSKGLFFTYTSLGGIASPRSSSSVVTADVENCSHIQARWLKSGAVSSDAAHEKIMIEYLSEEYLPCYRLDDFIFSTLKTFFFLLYCILGCCYLLCPDYRLEKTLVFTVCRPRL